nr:MAG TPA: protein of unknown function (UPF0146) [Caudoviricetes sp.]
MGCGDGEIEDIPPYYVVGMEINERAKVEHCI